MDNILQFQEALGSLIDIVPEPEKVKRKTHKVELLYDTRQSSVPAAWADCSSHVSKAYSVLTSQELANPTYVTCIDIDIGERLSLKEISKLVNEGDQDSILATLRNWRRVVDVSK